MSPIAGIRTSASSTVVVIIPRSEAVGINGDAQSSKCNAGKCEEELHVELYGSDLILE
jgi:hypothetical protein